MKYKMMASILALTVMTWAQTATPTTPAPQQSTVPAAKDKCPCCDKMAATDAKDAHASCMQHDMKAGDGKEKESCCVGKDAAASCCSGKDAMSCMTGDKDKTAASSCGDKCSKDKTAAACCSGKCAKDGEKGCCPSEKKAEKAAKSCCEDELRSENNAVHNYAALGK